MSSCERDSTSAVGYGGDRDWKTLGEEEEEAAAAEEKHSSHYPFFSRRLHLPRESAVNHRLGLRVSWSPECAVVRSSNLLANREKNTERAQSHCQLQLGCCTTEEEGTRGHQKVSEKPNYQLVIHCQEE